MKEKEMEMMPFDCLFDALADMAYAPKKYSSSTSKTYPRATLWTIPSDYIRKDNSLDIPVSRVIYSGKTTTVYFTDGTKTTVTCSENDKYDRQTAIAYALLKKIYGKVGRYDKNGNYHANEIDGNGIGLKLEKIAASGYDQDAEEKLAKEKKTAAKANHIAKQQAEHDAAWERRVRARAEQLRLEREANALLDKEDSLKKTTGKKILNESTKTVKEDSSWMSYRKPDKPFSKFTRDEKREYWRYHNAKRQASK